MVLRPPPTSRRRPRAALATPLALALALAALPALAGCDGGSASGGGGDSAPRDVRLIVEEPLAGALLASPSVRVAGRLEAAPRASSLLRVNGADVTADGGRFAIEVPLVDGPNRLEIVHPESGAHVELTVDRDAHPPVVELLSPGMGDWLDADASGTTVTVRVRASDDRALTSLRVGDVDLPTTATGEQTVELSLSAGVGLIRATATDAAGNRTDEHVAVLVGPREDADAVRPDAVALGLGGEALAVLGAAAARLVDAVDLAGLATARNPVYSSTLADVSVTDVRYARPSLLELEPRTGALALRAELRDLAVDVFVDTALAFAATVHARSVVVSANARPYVDDGVVRVELTEVDVALDGFVVDFGSNEPQVDGEQGLIDDAIAGLARSTAESVLTDVVPAALSAALAAAAVPRTFELLGARFEVEALPERVTVTDDGLLLGLGVRVALDRSGASGAGALTLGAGLGALVPPPGLMAALSSDGLNVILHQAWRGGLLSFTVDRLLLAAAKSQLELVAGLLGGLLRLLPDAPGPETPIAIELDAGMPPIARTIPGAGDGDLLELTLGALDLRVRTDAPNLAERTLFGATMSLRVAASASVQDGRLTLVPGRFELDFDVRDPTLRAVGADAYSEPVARALGDTLARALTLAVGELALPAIAGLRVTSARLRAGGSDARSLQLDADVAPAP